MDDFCFWYLDLEKTLFTIVSFSKNAFQMPSVRLLKYEIVL